MSLSRVEVKKNEFYTAIDRLPQELAELLIPVLMAVVNQTGEKAIFLARALQALEKLAGEADVSKAAGAASEYELLVTALQRPEALRLLPSCDPLANAKIRGLIAKQDLLETTGGCLSSEEAAKVLQITRQAIDKRRKQGKLIGLQTGRSYRYPVWQFDNGKTLPHLSSVLQSLNISEPWMQVAWMLDSNLQLDGKTPLACLQEGEFEAVLAAAATYGEQGAT